MHIITLNEPVCEENTVSFSWSITPPTALYSQSHCTLRFPDSVPIDNLPQALWWRIAFIVLHSQWPLLRPCRIVLPVRLPAGEREFWLRLMDSEVATFEFDGGFDDTWRAIEIVDGGPPLADLPQIEGRGGAVCCFSGGKDSTTQAALLGELGEDVVLAMTTSRVQWSNDYDSAPRRETIDGILARRPFELLELESDLRGILEHDFARPRYKASLNEINDCFLHLANAIVVAFARNIGNVYMASEAEVQQNARHGGLIVEHRHRMYSAVTLQALDGLLRGSGVQVSSLTYGLHFWQVQTLLATRYRDLLELQYSCWSAGPDERACSRCGECRQIALNLLGIGVDPAAVGIDIVTMLRTNADWRPKRVPELAAAPDRPPADARQGDMADGKRDMELAQLRSLAQTPDELVAALIGETTVATAEEREQALRAWSELRAVARSLAPDPAPGYRADYLRFMPEHLRARVTAIFDANFPRDDGAPAAGIFARSCELLDWITAPLASASTQPRSDAPAPTIDELERIALGPLAAAIPDGEPELQPYPDAAGDVRPIVPVSDTRLTGNESRYLAQCVETNWVSSAGPFVTRFEEEFAAVAGCRFAVACSSGTAALHLALLASGIGPGDEVLIPTFTMIATANAIRYAGATPVLVDSDPLTWNVDSTQLAAKLTPRTRAVLVVHTYGRAVDMDPVLDLAARHRLTVIEDAAEAHGATHNERPVGGIGAVGAFSFYGNKILTSGEGGMVTTNDPALAERARNLCGHAFSKERHFWHRALGFNYRMTNLQAAVGLAQTEQLDALIAQRRTTAARYIAALRDIPGIVLAPDDAAGRESVWWMFGALVDDSFAISRDELRRRLAAAGIETRTFFVPIHMQPLYRAGFPGQRYPVAERLARTGLYVPSGPNVTADEVVHVADQVRLAGATRKRAHADAAPA
jgi:perosamine synthetase